MEHDELVQAAERALRDAELAYREDPSDARQRRVMRVWEELREIRGDPPLTDPPFPFLAPRPRDS